MRKQTILLTLLLALLLTASNLYAYSYCYNGCFEAPEVTGSVDVTGGEGGVYTAHYLFSNLPTDYGIMALSLGFDNPFAPVTESQSLGWYMGVADGNLLLATMSQTATPGLLSFDVNIDLSDGIQWDWHQSFLGVYTKCLRIVKFCGTIDGPGYPVAEPGTMVLLGISMLTLAGYGRRQMRRS